MKNSKLIRLLASLSVWEWKRFLLFVDSPFHNQHGKVKILARYLHDQHPAYPVESVSKTALHRELWGIEAFQAQSVYNVCSLLTKLCEEFLAITHLQGKKHELKVALMESLVAKGLEKDFEQAKKKLQKRVPSPMNFEDYYYKFKISEISIVNWASNGGIRPGSGVLELLENLDRWYFILRFRYAGSAISQQNLYQIGVRPDVIEKLYEYVQQNEQDYEDIPLLFGFYMGYSILRRPAQDEEVASFHEYLNRNQGNIPHLPYLELNIYLINQYARRFNRGDTASGERLLDLYMTLLKQGVLVDQGWLTHWNYKNIVSIYLKLRKYGMAEQFLESYRDQVNPDLRDDVYHLSKAHLCFCQGDYPASLHLIQQIQSDHVLYQLGKKALMIKIFYATRSYEILFSKLDAFEIFLKRPRKIGTFHRDLYLEFVRLTRRMAQVRQKAEVSPLLLRPREWQQLAQAIRNETPSAQKEWLKEEIQKLQANHGVPD